MKGRNWVVVFLCMLALVGLLAACAGAQVREAEQPTQEVVAKTEQPTQEVVPTAEEVVEAKGFQVAPEIQKRVEAGETLVFRLSYVDPSLEFAQEIIRGINDAAKELGVDAKMIGPTPIDTAKQVAELETLVEQGGLDGMGVTSIDDAIFVPLMDGWIDKGFPVVTFNVDSPSSRRLAYFGQDNYAAGRTSAGELVKYLGSNPSGKVAVISHDPSFSSLRDRAQGIEDVLKDYPDIEYLGVFGDFKSDLEAGYGVIENLYTQHPDLKALVGIDGTSSPLIGRFISQNNLKDEVIGGGFDLIPDVLGYIKGGDMKWSVGQFPYKQGYMAVYALYDAAHGKMPESFDVGAEIVDATNVDKYLK
jgi:simple sugar transport system substrate-binding protein